MWIPRHNTKWAGYLPIDENETELLALREALPHHAVWTDPDRLRALRVNLGLLDADDAEQMKQDDMRLRQYGPDHEKLNDPDMEFFEGAQGAEKYRKTHRL